MTIPADPSALFREMLGQWEKLANGVGGDLLKTGEFARTMHGATNATATAQAALHQVMDRALAAANMPSRAEVEDLSARIAGIEATLLRIEAKLGEMSASGTASDLASRTRQGSTRGPTRGRKPPEPV